jgi:integrase
MELQAPSRTSLADVIALIAASALSDIQKRDQSSAVRTVARLLNAKPADISADPGRLRRKLERIAPEANGISRGRWANIRSLLGKALSLARTMQPGRSNAPILPAWEQLLEKLDRNRATRLKPLLRYLSAGLVTPSNVDREHLEAYYQMLLDDRLRAGPEKTWDSLLWSWNACARDVEGWPAIVIPRMMRREVYTQSWSAFPASLKQDVDAFLLRLSGKDLSEDGPLRPVRPGTLKTREYQLRLAASALALKGVEADRIQMLADLVMVDHFKLILQFLIDRKGDATGSRIGQMASFLKGVAEHWVKADDVEVSRLKRLAGRFSTRRCGMTAKNRERLRPLDDHEVVATFLALPDRIRADVERDKRPAKRKAIKAQMAVAIAILQVAPIRIENLARLDMHHHLIERGDQIYLVIDGDAVKNGEPVDFALPSSVVDILVWYATNYRPHLVRAPTQALFPGKGAGPKSARGLGAQISRAVHHYAGLAFHPHLFRHAAGKIYLDQRPGEYEVVRRILGHRSIETTTAIYTGAETRSAGQHYAKVIDGLRKRTPARPAPRRPVSQAQPAEDTL